MTEQLEASRLPPGSQRVPFVNVDGATHPGAMRETNEDAFLTADLNRTLVLGPSSKQFADGALRMRRANGKLLVVADGITASGAGALASSVAVDVLSRYVTSTMPWFVDIDGDGDPIVREEIEQAMFRCQRRLRELAKAEGLDDRPIGTTMTIGYIVWPHLFIAHVGDSRAYLARNGRLRRLTADHTVGQQLVDRHVLDEEMRENTPFDNILTNTIGGPADDIDMEFHRVELHPGDTILLCTDGLTKHVSDYEIGRCLAVAGTTADACRRLIGATNAAGGSDNVTVVCARATTTPVVPAFVSD